MNTVLRKARKGKYHAKNAAGLSDFATFALFLRGLRVKPLTLLPYTTQHYLAGLLVES
jgi:hypothetical protein